MKALLLLLALCPAARAQSAAGAQRLYDQGDYAAAAVQYRALAYKEPREAAWRYDLGNCLYKSGQLGRAIASYQRAFDLAPRDGDVRFNLAFALRRAGEDLVPAGVPPLLFVAFNVLSAAELAGLHWLGCWLTLLLGAWFLAQPKRRGLLSPCLIAAAALWLIAGSWWALRSWIEPSELGVVVVSTAELRSGPGEAFDVSFTVPEGRRVEVLSKQGDWLEVGLAKQGAKGFVRADAVEIP